MENCKKAFPPQSVTILLEDDIDVSRGDMLVRENNVPDVTQDIEVMMCWFNERPLQEKGKIYYFFILAKKQDVSSKKFDIN